MGYMLYCIQGRQNEIAGTVTNREGGGGKRERAGRKYQRQNSYLANEEMYALISSIFGLSASSVSMLL